MNTQGISIHAPREGGDACGLEWGAQLEYFNPRPPRGGRRALVAALLRNKFISIHAPREGGDPNVGVNDANWEISIHAPREGGDARVG